MRAEFPGNRQLPPEIPGERALKSVPDSLAQPACFRKDFRGGISFEHPLLVGFNALRLDAAHQAVTREYGPYFYWLYMGFGVFC
jgi:hypothetical protein